MELSAEQSIADAMKRTIRLFEESGAEIVEISLPTVTRYATACYYAIVTSEAYTNLARFDGVRCGYAAEAAGLRGMFEAVRSEGFCGDAKTRIIMGTYLTEPGRYEEYYQAATRVRTLIADEFYKAFDSGKIDCILQPVAGSLPRKIGEPDINAMNGHELDIYLLPANLAGLPGFSFPAGHAEDAEESGLPVGLQIIGPRWSDGELLDIGFELEKISGAQKTAVLER